MRHTPSIHIAEARQVDALTIASIHAESWRINYRGALSDSFLDEEVVRNRVDLWQKRLTAAPDDQLVLVARQQGDQPADQTAGTVVGFACAYFGDDREWGTMVDNLHVVPDAQRQGIGAALLAAVAQWSLARDPRAGLYLWVLEQNAKARQFYQRLNAWDAGGDIWDPPGGGSVPRRRYVWRDLERLSSGARDDSAPAEPF